MFNFLFVNMLSVYTVQPGGIFGPEQDRIFSQIKQLKNTVSQVDQSLIN